MKLSMAFASVALLAACSSSSGSSTSASKGDAGGDDAAAPDGPAEAIADGSGACNTLANTGQPVMFTQVSMDPPAMTGGAVASGTYVLTDAKIYTGPQGPTGASGTVASTIQVSATSIQVVTSGGPPNTRTESLAWGTTTFTATDTCPDSTVIRGSYTATVTTLVVQFPGGTDDAGARTVQETFTKS